MILSDESKLLINYNTLNNKKYYFEFKKKAIMALMKMFLRQKLSQQHPMVTSLLSVNPIFLSFQKTVVIIICLII